MKHRTRSILAISAALAFPAAFISGCGSGQAQTPVFTLSSPDLATGTFSTKFILNGFGCTGQNVSPELQWSNPPAGTQSFALQVYDPDAPTGSGFWHWGMYDIPAAATGLAQAAGNSAATLPLGAYGGNTDFLDTGATGGNGNYGGPCPPAGDKAHRYIFTLYALSISPPLTAAAGIPKTGTAGLYGFALGRAGLGSKVLGTASFTATYGR